MCYMLIQFCSFCFQYSTLPSFITLLHHYRKQMFIMQHMQVRYMLRQFCLSVSTSVCQLESHLLLLLLFSETRHWRCVIANNLHTVSNQDCIRGLHCLQSSPYAVQLCVTNMFIAFRCTVTMCWRAFCTKEPAVALAKKGYHILLEKPMAVSFIVFLLFWHLLTATIRKVILVLIKRAIRR